MESGNVMIYVLIVVALFAALTFVLARQNRSGEQETLSYEKTQLYANQIMQVANQLKQGLDQMIYMGARIDELDFCRPQDPCFAGTTGKINFVFHPDGGGLSLPALADEVVAPTVVTPEPGYYMAHDLNVEWTRTDAHDVILTAYGIREELCRRINESLTGLSAIPVLGSTTLQSVFVIGGTDLTTSNCPDCEDKSAACITDSTGAFAFYSILAQ